LVGGAALPALAQSGGRDGERNWRSYGSENWDDRQQFGRGGYGSDESMGMSREMQRQIFERGYRMGRMEQHRRDMAAWHEMRRARQSMMGGGQEGLLVLMIERDRQQQALREVRGSLQEARQALQRGDRSAAEQALGSAEDTLRQANSLQSQQRVLQSLGEVEDALEQGDRNAARQALREARQALNQAAAQRSGSSSSASGMGTSGGSTMGGTGSSTGSSPTGGSGATGGSTTTPGTTSR
jgi:ribosomal protein S20